MVRTETNEGGNISPNELQKLAGIVFVSRDVGGDVMHDHVEGHA